MTKTILRVTLSGTFAVLTALMILAAKYLSPVVFAFYPALSRQVLGILAGVTSVLPLAVWELAVVALVLWFVVTLIRALVRRRIVRWLAGLLLLVCVFAFAFVGVWGLNYYAPSMQSRLELPERQYSAAELKEAALYYRDMANATAPLVERDENGVMCAGDFDELANAAGDGYKTLAQTMECFDGSTVRVKKLLSSPILGATGTTGVFICLTGESGVSTTTFSASLPFTMCHEIGHRMAFAREDEANFAGYLACEASERADFRYSGYYSAYIYCYNALHRVDPTAAAEVRQGCCSELLTDCAAASTHYDELENKTASTVYTEVYDTYLKSFSVESGVQSYGEVADLLLTWYFERLR